MAGKTNPIIILIITIIFICASAAGGVWLYNHSKKIKITVAFPNAQGIGKGKYVEYKGIKIGHVEDVKVNLSGEALVSLKIDPEHAEHVRQKALFAISSDISTGPPPGVVLGYCKDENPYDAPQLESGSVIRGEKSELTFVLKTVVGCFDETQNSLHRALDDLKKSFAGAFNSEKLDELYRDIETFLLKLNKKAQEQAKRFLQEEAPEIRKKIEELIKELERLGRDSEAEKWKEFLDEELQENV